MTLQEYIKMLAERHVDIRHRDDGEVHYLSSDAKKVTAIDSELCYPAVIYDRGAKFRYAGMPGAYRKETWPVLMIVDKVHDTSDYVSIDGAFDRCVVILDEFMNRMLSDKGKPELKRVLGRFRLEDVECEYVENADNMLYGVAAFIDLDMPMPGADCREAFID